MYIEELNPKCIEVLKRKKLEWAAQRKERNRKIMAILEEAGEKWIGPTEIARKIGEEWCMTGPGGYPASNKISPVLKRIGAKRNCRGKWKMDFNTKENKK